MKHTMKLDPKYFDFMKNGTKRVELRLYDDKRKSIKIGDEIVFTKLPDLKEELLTYVIDLIKEDSFEKLVSHFDISKYADKSILKEEFLNDLYKFYSREEEKQYGVIGIIIDLK